MDHLMRKQVLWNGVHQVLLDLLGIAVPGQIQAQRDTLHMRVHQHTRGGDRSV